MVFAIHWHESAMDLLVLPNPIPPPTTLPIPSLRVFPVHQLRALVSCMDIRKDPDAGEDCRQEEKGAIEDEMVGWHHRVTGHEFEQTLEMAKAREAWVLQSMGLQRVSLNWATEQKQTISSAKAVLCLPYQSNRSSFLMSLHQKRLPV